MAIVNSIKTKEYANENQILIAPELAFTVGCLVNANGITANDEGRKIVPAGTIVGASNDVLLERDTVLSKVSDSTAQGVLLHDVDVTDGDANATLVIAGYIDLLKLEENTASALESGAENLPKITIMNGYKG